MADEKLENTLGLSIFADKLRESISSQKAQYDRCVEWLLLVNGGMIAIILRGYPGGKDPYNPQQIMLLAFIGLIVTFFLMFRSCRAYLNLELVAKPHRHFLKVIMMQATWKKATNILI